MNDQIKNSKNMNQQAIDPKKAQIHNLIIVDESGSMGGLEKVTIGGINETIATIKKAQEDFADTQQHYLTLLTFEAHVDGQHRHGRTHRGLLIKCHAIEFFVS